MGRLTRVLAVIPFGAAAWLALSAAPAMGFDGFGDLDANGTYGAEMRFSVELHGGAPDRLELLLSTPGSEADFVAPVQSSAGSATYVWDTSVDYVTPNTPVSFRWRATNDGEVTVSEGGTLLYDDDRPSLAWREARIGEATVHWYGDTEGQARRFGDLTTEAVERAEDLLDASLDGPVDIFVYDTRDEFFGALGPGAREWTGAAAYPHLRTIFMQVAGNGQAYLDTVVVHEVMHVVFYDATNNPYHEPARWLNEGIATWSETDEADEERAIVQLEANGGGLFAFEAIAEQFPIGQRGGQLSYAQGATMIDVIVDRFGRDAIGRIAAAYREGASDAQALEAGTGLEAETLYAEFYASFGVDPPLAVEPEPILPSNVERPPAGEIDGPGGSGGGPDDPGPAPAPGEPLEEAGGPGLLVLVPLGLAAVAALIAVIVVARRAGRRA
ncbi:MAG: peptidase MA family metallohydrolase [Candidatus Limnocylindria bacterium]